MDQERLKKNVSAVLVRFFQEEHGNRITSNNINGLLGTLLAVIDGRQPGGKENTPDDKNETQKES